MKTSTDALVPVAKKRYKELQSSRQTPLERARQNSDLTIPGIVPAEGQDANASFSQPYQSLGARAVNNLAAWLLITQLPPDQQFFRLSIHEDTAEELGAGLSEIKTGLNRISSKAQLHVETVAARPVLMEVYKQLIVAGNALLYFPLEGRPRMYRLDQFVVLRDESGEMIEAVIEEKVYPSTLSEETRAATAVVMEVDAQAEKLVELHTHIKRDAEDNIVHYQEINGLIVPDSEGTAPKDKAGWMALRWNAVPGSDYGRAHVTEYIGDLLSLEDLTKAIIQFAAVASRIIHIVDPNSGLDVEELAKAESGDFLTGYADKIKALQLDKSMDFSVVSEVSSRIELRLSHAFMLQSGTVRNAERVTAEEIRAMAQELENVLGGVYTVLSAELQLPMVRRLMYILQRNGDAPELPKDVTPTIVTGFEALGRNHTANKLRAFIADMKSAFGEGALSKVMDMNEVGLRLADNHGIEDVDKLLKSPDRQAEEDQQAATTQAAMGAAPQLAKGMMDGMNAPEPEAPPQ